MGAVTAAPVPSSASRIAKVARPLPPPDARAGSAVWTGSGVEERMGSAVVSVSDEEAAEAAEVAG